MKWAARLFILFVACLNADLIAGAGEPKPDYLRWPYGIAAALTWTAPLWMSTLKFASRWRLSITLLMLLTGVMTSFAMLGYNAIVAGTVALIHLFLIANLIVKNSNERIAITSQTN